MHVSGFSGGLGPRRLELQPSESSSVAAKVPQPAQAAQPEPLSLEAFGRKVMWKLEAQELPLHICGLNLLV